MKCFPFSAQRADYVLHPASKSVCVDLREAVIPEQGRWSMRTLQIKYGMLAVIEHMHVGRQMVVQINHDAGSADAENRWHVLTLSVSRAQVNPNAWVYLRHRCFPLQTAAAGDVQAYWNKHCRRYQPNGR
jgi:hypothetical protein